MKQQKMNLHVLAIMLLIFGNPAVQGRAIDDPENSIESSERSSAPRFEQDWIKLTKAPPSKIVQTDSFVEIACEVMGSQVPTIEWVVGHMLLPELDGFESNMIAETSSSAIVRVRSVHIVEQLLNEPRTYTCVGRTGSKTISASTTVYPQADFKDLVSVHDKPLGPHKPRIVYNEKLHLDLVGSNIVLPCKVHARPRAEVFWMNGEGKIIEPNHHFKILPSGHLLISEIKWEDMGAYKCIARNSLGKDSADTFIYPVLKEEK